MKKLLLILAISAITAYTQSLPIDTITDDDIKTGKTVHWKADTIRILKGVVMKKMTSLQIIEI